MNVMYLWSSCWTPTVHVIVNGNKFDQFVFKSVIDCQNNIIVSAPQSELKCIVPTMKLNKIKQKWMHLIVKTKVWLSDWDYNVFLVYI